MIFSLEQKATSVTSNGRRMTLEIVAKKKWEKQALTPRGLPVRIPMHVKTGDKVIPFRVLTRAR